MDPADGGTPTSTVRTSRHPMVAPARLGPGAARRARRHASSPDLSLGRGRLAWDVPPRALGCVLSRNAASAKEGTLSVRATGPIARVHATADGQGVTGQAGTHLPDRFPVWDRCRSVAGAGGHDDAVFAARLGHGAHATVDDDRGRRPVRLRVPDAGGPAAAVWRGRLRPERVAGQCIRSTRFVVNSS